MRTLQWNWFRLSFQLRNALLGDRPIDVEVADVSFRLVPKGAIATGVWKGRFERHALRFILEVLRPGMTFMDVGSNVGLFAVAAAKDVEPGTVYAFEPSTWTFQILQQNVRLNNLTNVIPAQVALGDYTGNATLKINAPGKDGLNTIGEPSHSGSQIIGEEIVPITTLDAFMDTNDVTHVDVMKVDVEGAERLVFRGASRVLSGSDAPLILYEGYSWCTAGFGYRPIAIMQLLEGYGYSFFALNEDGLTPVTPDQDRDAMIVAAKPGHSSFDRLCESRMIREDRGQSVRRLFQKSNSYE